MGKLLIGWAEESIVPEKKASLAGQFCERISEYVESDITVTAMAVEADGNQMIMASVDVAAFSETQLSMAREKFAKLTSEIDPRKLIVCVTHTHTSLVMAGRAMSKGKTGAMVSPTAAILEEFIPADKSYTRKVVPDETVCSPEEALELVSDKIALAAKRAWDDRKEAMFIIRR